MATNQSKRSRDQTPLNILGCLALLHAIRSVKLPRVRKG